MRLGVDGLSCGVGLLWESAAFEFLDFDFERWAVAGRLRWDFARPAFLEADVTLHGFEQELEAEMMDGNLVVRDLLVRDYPLLVRLED